MASDTGSRTRKPSIAEQSQAMIDSATQGATQAHTDLANAKADQAGQIAGNATLAGQVGGTINPTTGHITLPTGGAVIPGINPSTGGTGGAGGTAGTGGAGTTVTPTDLTGTDANSILTNGLNDWGLGDLSTQVNALIKQGINIAGIADYIRKTPSYAKRFPAMAGLNASGHGISEMAYLAKEETDRQLLYTYLGDHAKNYDNPAQLGTLMTNFVSPVELQGRLQAIHDVVNSSTDTKNWLKSTYGYSDQDLAAAWLDPKLASDTIARRDSAAQIGGAGVTSGFGQLTQAQAEALVNQGVTQSQAQSTFGKIGNTGQLEQNLPGNDTGSLSQQQILDGAFTGGAAGQTLANLQSSRVAQFQANGGAIADSSGVAGDRMAMM